MTEDEDIDGLAAEYVLGSLDPSERVAVDVRRRSDRALADAIGAWERRLGPLSWRAPEVQPPAHLWHSILERIGTPKTAEVVFLRRIARRWRGIAAAATAIAACLSLAVAWFLYERINAPTRLVAELYRAAGTSTADEIMHPAFVVSVDLNPCAITARPVTAQPRPGRNYQLWIMRQGVPAAESLGVLSGPEALTVPCPAPIAPATLLNATLAVSQEPDGGSTTGTPTGSFAFLGKLMAVDPAAEEKAR
jgi:anti-sigma-K factor RskA